MSTNYRNRANGLPGQRGVEQSDVNEVQSGGIHPVNLNNLRSRNRKIKNNEINYDIGSKCESLPILL